VVLDWYFLLGAAAGATAGLLIRKAIYHAVRSQEDDDP
jgi:hypothetical protein